MFRNAGQHARPDFNTIMKCENKVGIAVTGQDTVRARLALD